MLPEGWKTLSGDTGDDLVVAMDFEAAGRAEACFADLVPLLDPARQVWIATQPDAGAGAADRLRYWSDGLRASGRKVRAVLGFCAGGLYAAALAETVAQWQDALPDVVVFDPEPPTPDTLVKQFDNTVRSLASVLSETELEEVREAVRRVAAEHADPAELNSLGDALAAVYRECSGPALEKIGLRADFREDLAATFESLMGYLAAAADVPLSDGWASVTAIVSATPIWEPAGVLRAIRTDVAHADLLRSPEIARIVSDELQEDRHRPLPRGSMTSLNQLVATVLELPLHDIDDKVGPATHESWTSLRHFQLVISVEENYGITLGKAEIRSVRSVGDLRRLITEKGGTP